MKETLDLRGLNFEEGYIAVIDKPLSWTSTDVVRKIKSALRRLGYRKIKVGHAGTLDPLATGVLLVCIGRATKMVDALQAEEKEYVADAMVTNFHLPYSTQLMMVAAFGGYETIMNAYKIAKEEGYRFGTYGDAMLIL